jgi:hypothetical protein
MNRSQSRQARRTRPGGGSAREAASDHAAGPGPTACPFPDASPQARRLAAVILEVLAGTQTPCEAAAAVSLSLARYYQLELRAVAGLVAACEVRHRGRGRSPGNDLTQLRQECERLRRECARQQALVRATRRTVGLASTAPQVPAEGSRQRKRRPTARALKMAALLQPPEANPSQAPGPDTAEPATSSGPS